MRNSDFTYRYPPRLARIVTMIWMFILAFNLAEYLLAWARAFYWTVRVQLQLPLIDFLTPLSSVIEMMLIAHIGLLIALIVVYAISFLTPRILVYDTGLQFISALGKQWIPFTALRGIRSTELHDNGRFIVWVSATKGLPLQGLLGSLLFGRWVWRGFLLTSDLNGFDNILATIVEQLKRKYGEQDYAAHFSEEPPTWLLQMFNAPHETIRKIVAEEVFPIPQEQATRQMIFIAASLAIPMLVGAIIHLQFPLGAILLPIVALIEFPLVSFYFTALPVDSPRRMDFADAMRIYPLTQLPRWLVSIGLTLLIIAGVPPIIMILAPLPAIALSIVTVTTLTEAWFEIHSPDSWVGVLVTVIYQLVLYEFFVWMIPR